MNAVEWLLPGDSVVCPIQPEIGKLYWVSHQNVRLLAVMMANGKWLALIDGAELSNVTEYELA